MSTLRVICTILVVALVGCAQVAQRPVPANKQTAWAQYQKMVSKITHINLSGVLGVRLADQAQRMNLNLDYTPKHYLVELSGPLGIGSATIEKTADTICLKTSDDKSQCDKNEERLLQSLLGWSVPMKGAFYWLKGLPIPNVNYDSTLTKYGQLNWLTQEGWQIQYLSYHGREQYYLPSKIRLKRGQLTLMVIVNDWIL